MILDLISFIDYIFILRGKEKNVNFDHSITIHNFGISLKLIRSFYIELEMVLFLSSYPSYYFLRGPGWIWEGEWHCFVDHQIKIAIKHYLEFQTQKAMLDQILQKVYLIHFCESVVWVQILYDVGVCTRTAFPYWWYSYITVKVWNI